MVMADPIELRPGRRDFPSLAAVRQAFPDLRLPSTLPAGAQFALALWQYPPLFTVRQTAGRTEVTSTDYNIPPTLGRGSVQVVYKVGDGVLGIEQGVVLPFGNPNNAAAGVATTRRLPNGRTVLARTAQGPSVPGGRLNIVAWTSDSRPRRQFVLWSDVLSTEELERLAATM